MDHTTYLWEAGDICWSARAGQVAADVDGNRLAVSRTVTPRAGVIGNLEDKESQKVGGRSRATIATGVPT